VFLKALRPLPEQSKERAPLRIGRIRDGLTSVQLLRNENINVKLTASFGIATFAHDAKDKRGILVEGDQFMYRAEKEERIK
jgi:GGDEF domain-containing protein